MNDWEYVCSTYWIRIKNIHIYKENICNLWWIRLIHGEKELIGKVEKLRSAPVIFLLSRSIIARLMFSLSFSPSLSLSLSHSSRFTLRENRFATGPDSRHVERVLKKNVSHNETLPYCRLYQTSDPRRRDLHDTNHKNSSTGITSFRYRCVTATNFAGTLKGRPFCTTWRQIEQYRDLNNRQYEEMKESHGQTHPLYTPVGRRRQTARERHLSCLFSFIPTINPWYRFVLAVSLFPRVIIACFIPFFFSPPLVLL